MKKNVNALGFLSVFVLCLLASPLRATDYYVSPTGSDANSGRSASAPWATLYTSVNRLHPGDRLIVMDGRYVINDYDYIITPPSGQTGAWVTIEGQAGSRPLPVGGNNLDRMITLSGKNYVHLKNLEITHDDQAMGEGMWFRNGIVATMRGCAVT